MSDELDPQLKELFAAEKDEPPPEETKKRLAGALATTLALPLPTAALTATKLAPVAKGMVTAAKAWAMAGAAFVAGGTAVVVWTAARAPAPLPPMAPTLSVAPPSPPPPTAAQLFTPTPVDTADKDAGAASSAVEQDSSATGRVPAASSSVMASGISAERALLDDARAAVNGSDYGRALRMLDRHAHQFPHGQLWEEREALAIDALVHTQDYAQARTRADRLRDRSPNSLFMPLVDADLRSIP